MLECESVMRNDISKNVGSTRIKNWITARDLKSDLIAYQIIIISFWCANERIIGLTFYFVFEIFFNFFFETFKTDR